MGQDVLVFPAQRQEVGHAVVETEAKPRPEVIWVYHLAPDSRWAEHCNLPFTPQIEHSLLTTAQHFDKKYTWRYFAMMNKKR